MCEYYVVVVCWGGRKRINMTCVVWSDVVYLLDCCRSTNWLGFPFSIIQQHSAQPVCRKWSKWMSVCLSLLSVYGKWKLLWHNSESTAYIHLTGGGNIRLSFYLSLTQLNSQLCVQTPPSLSNSPTTLLYTNYSPNMLTIHHQNLLHMYNLCSPMWPRTLLCLFLPWQMSQQGPYAGFYFYPLN